MSAATSGHRLEARLRGLFDQAGARGWLHAVDIDDPARAVAVDADEAVPIASVFKVLLLVELLRQADAGRLDLTDQLEVPVEGRTSGGTGIAMMRDPIRMSMRDLAYLMISVSDVAATDVLLEHVGIDAVNATAARLGLQRTRVRETCRAMLDSIAEDLGAATSAQLATRLTDPGAVRRLRALDPERATAGTARELTATLAAIWRDEAASPEACAQMRALLASQVWPHRLAAGFPSDDIAVAGKTGTLPTLRHEIGVVELPTGRRFAVAVLTQSQSAAMTLPQVDATIGAAARTAVDALAAMPAGGDR